MIQILVYWRSIRVTYLFYILFFLCSKFSNELEIIIHNLFAPSSSISENIYSMIFISLVFSASKRTKYREKLHFYSRKKLKLIYYEQTLGSYIIGFLKLTDGHLSFVSIHVYYYYFKMVTRENKKKSWAALRYSLLVILEIFMIRFFSSLNSRYYPNPVVYRFSANRNLNDGCNVGINALLHVIAFLQLHVINFEVVKLLNADN